VQENLRQKAGVKLTMVILAESILPSHPAHAYFKRRYARAREILAGHLGRAKGSGYLRADVDPQRLATTLLATMDGLQLQWLLDSTVDMAACFEELARILVTALPAPRRRARSTATREA
jgi:hypothetical protein